MDKASLRRMLEEFERDNAKLKQARVLHLNDCLGK